MKKTLIFLLVLIATIFNAVPVCAMNNEISVDISAEDYLPQEAKDILTKNNIDSFDYKTLKCRQMAVSYSSLIICL